MTGDRHPSSPEGPPHVNEESPTLPPSSAPPLYAAGSPPKEIGPYRIAKLLGEGGMGSVYLAMQERPVRRQVALKLIKPGMDSRAVLARFESERQALALMDHPGIAKVLDAGTTESGRPYFVMELVQGVTLTRYCDENRLNTKQRLQIFQKICDAVQHAHQKSVIHRDLKPSNILVTVHGDEVQPKVIDFGLAKALATKLTDKTLVTAHGVFMGTPAYTSPEQADVSAFDVDTRTDIYALGVILYELLVGKPPFDFDHAILKAAFDEIRRMIREEDPMRPSARVTTLGETGRDAARRRRLDPTTLSRNLRGDLDWIVMKALEKDRTRRYGTALEFKADIERHLRHEPVDASPPGAGYRLGKFLRKYRRLVLTLSSIFVVLMAGVISSTLLYLRAESARETAEVREGEARTAEAETRDALAREELARSKAENAERLLSAQYEDILRLSDLTRLAEVLEAANEDLWPAHPEKIEAMEDWLLEARRLGDNLEHHQTTLASLRQKAGRPGQNAGSMSHVFPDTETQWRHDTLVELVQGLERLVDPDPTLGTLAAVEERLAFAKAVHDLSITSHQTEWDRAVASIADVQDCPQYGGLALPVQLGLVPIGRDPVSGLWEFAHLQTGEVPSRDAEGHLALAEETGLVFVLVPGGEFFMGAQNRHPDRPNYDRAATGDEGPVRKVVLAPFFLSKYEMTQAQWSRFTGSNPSLNDRDNYSSFWNRRRRPWSGLHPVEQISHEEARRNMNRLGLSLPTEAQWEFAARAGTTTPWWTGTTVESLLGAANVSDRFFAENGIQPGWAFDTELDDGHSIHAPIGSFAANPFGLHDTLGNVHEHCRDAYLGYDQPVREDTGERHVKRRRRSRGRRAQEETFVLRGGNFYVPATYARSAKRANEKADYTSDDLGLRPAREIEREP